MSRFRAIRTSPFVFCCSNDILGAQGCWCESSSSYLYSSYSLHLYSLCLSSSSYSSHSSLSSDRNLMWRHRSIRLTDAIQHNSGRFLTKKKFAAASLTEKQAWHATILVLDPPSSDGCCFWLLPSQSPSHYQHYSVIAVRKKRTPGDVAGVSVNLMPHFWSSDH